ncbi:hypothetical protein [Flavobacterium cellulosilyticum]|uniref:DUF3185 family protein n=1 Tax=Flavobacterium cellulosilyticum TaxID=2541731 RepID=A0A4R5CEG8_9FLAO|nr:hypothetical protein [Flavobacterium cellulosilyticum]TDD98441.1 hypothetical protein E0F76_04705 [Flavobacterium cellulosilyticum]
MNTKTLGIALVILGILMTVYTGFNYVTKEKVVDIGPIEINAEKNHPVQWTPIIGVLIIVGGIIIIGRSTSKNNRI